MRIEAMPTVRRVVTGHDDQGRAKIISDTTDELQSHRAGESSRVLWVTDGFPINNDDDVDRSAQEQKTSEDDGSVFRIIRYEPGVSPRNHRTNSIDYAVVLSGSIRLVLEEGSIELKAGDCLVQRGTIHNWINEGPDVCVIAFALIGARPVRTMSGVLEPTG
jgi:quercetin dioxygenase-like cupin family protein